MPSRREEEEALKAQERSARMSSRVLVPNLAHVIQDSDSNMSSPSGRVYRPVSSGNDLGAPAVYAENNPMTREEEEIMIKQRERQARPSSSSSLSSSQHRASSRVPNLASMVEDAVFISPSGNTSRPKLSTKLSNTSTGKVTMSREEEELMIKQRERAALSGSSHRASVVPNLANLVKEPSDFSLLDDDYEAPRSFASRDNDSLENGNYYRSTGGSGTAGDSRRISSMVPNLAEIVEPNFSRDPTTAFVSNRDVNYQPGSSQTEIRSGSSQIDLDRQQKDREREAAQGFHNSRSSTIVPNLVAQVSTARYDAVAQMLGDEDIGDQFLGSGYGSNDYQAQASPQRPSRTFQPASEDTVRARYQAATLAMGDTITQEDEDQILKDREREASQVTSSASTPSSAAYHGRSQQQYERDLEAKTRAQSARAGSASVARRSIDQAREDVIAKNRGASTRGLPRRSHQGDNNDLVVESVQRVAPGALAVVDGQAQVRAKGELTHIDTPTVREYVAPPTSSRTVTSSLSQGDISNDRYQGSTVASSHATSQAVNYSVPPDLEDQTQAADTMMAVTDGETTIGGDVTTVVGVEERLEDSKEHTSSNTNMRKWYILALVLIVVAGGVVAGVVIAGGGSGDDETPPVPVSSPTSTPTASPETEQVRAARAMLLENGVSSVEALSDFESAAYAALRWVGDFDSSETLDEPSTLVTRFAMAVFYYSMNGPRWLKNGNDEWLDADADVCDWDLIVCIGGEIDTIEAVNNINLEGTLPGELNALEYLRTISISNNEVRGFGAPLMNIEELKLETADLGSRFRGIPSDILEMTNLRKLDLSHNGIVGTISPDIQKLSLLDELRLSDNELSGTVTTEFSTMDGLQILDLSDNRLEGAMMDVISGLDLLLAFQAARNLFSGPVDSRMGGLSRLERFEVSGNELTGTFPNLLFDLTSIGVLDLSLNDFEGTIGTEIAQLTKTNFLYFSSLKISGTIPTEIGSLQQLVRFRVDRCQLSGTIPTEVGRLSRLEELWADSNFLTGSIPTEFGNLSMLESIQVGLNDLTGEVPLEVCNIPSLRQLVVAPLPCGDCTRFTC